MGSVLVWFTSFCARAVIPAKSAKSLSIFPHECMSTWFVIGPLTSSDIKHEGALYKEVFPGKT